MVTGSFIGVAHFPESERDIIIHGAAPIVGATAIIIPTTIIVTPTTAIVIAPIVPAAAIRTTATVAIAVTIIPTATSSIVVPAPIIAPAATTVTIIAITIAAPTVTVAVVAITVIAPATAAAVGRSQDVNSARKVADDDFAGIPVIALLVLPFARLELAFSVDLVALAHVLVGIFRRMAEQDDGDPFSAFLAVAAVAVLPGLAAGHAQVDDQVAALGVAGFRVCAEAADAGPAV